ncbi:hypothetical protein BC833DRAFT_48410 [Globomyces pollinis-pini]|nr:hypothetical protein BC833DRAFT_48410 [Globomyces pollinis-pini]
MSINLSPNPYPHSNILTMKGFDLMTWTTLLSTRKDFIQLECPVCGKSIHSQSLFVDDYIEDVLKRTSEDTEIVHITKDLNWINPNEEPMESNAAKKIKFDPQETVKSANSTSSNTQVVVLDESETDELESSNENTVIVDTNQPIGIAIEQTGSIMAQPAETNALPVQTKSTHSTPLQNPTAPTVQPIPRQSEEIPKNNQNEHGQETENEQPDTAKDASSLSHPSTTTPLPSQSIHNKHKNTDRTESSKSLSASHVSQSSNNTNAANAPNPNHSQCISTTSGANVDTNKNNLPNANSNANSNKSSTSNDSNVNETRNTNVSNAKTTACESIGKNTTESVSTESYPSLFDLNDSEKKQMGNIIEPEFEDDAFSDDTVSVADSDSESFT